MRNLVIGASVAALWAAFSAHAVRSQGTPRTCSEAQSACTKETSLPKECENERQWCLKTGTFAHPKTKAVSTGLQKR